jgi:hypothetical protein
MWKVQDCCQRSCHVCTWHVLQAPYRLIASNCYVYISIFNCLYERLLYTRLSYCMSDLYHNRLYVVVATWRFAPHLTFERIFYGFRNFRSYLHRSTSHVRHVHNLAPSHPALRLHSVTCIQPATDGEQILNITMQGSPRSSYESRPPPGHLLAQPRQSGSPTRSVRENHAHVVHESSNFGHAGRAKADGACKCGPLEREFSARSLPDSPDRSGCLSVVRQDDASGELDGRDQNHGVLQQACVARVTAARPRPHTSFQEAGLHRCEMCRLATCEPCVDVLGGGWMRIRSVERTPSALRPEISLPE